MDVQPGAAPPKMLRSALARTVFSRAVLAPIPRPALARSALAPLRRHLSTDWDVELKNAYVTMQLHPGATAKQIKKRFYELAKSCHPDVHQGAHAQKAPSKGPVILSTHGPLLEEEIDPVTRFLEVQAAYETLMEAAENGEQQPGGGGRKPEKGPKARAKTLGEVLVDRLVEEPEEVEAVWEDIKAQRLSVTVSMIDRLFKAHAYQGRTETNKGMGAGLGLLLEGVELGLVSQALPPMVAPIAAALPLHAFPSRPPRHTPRVAPSHRPCGAPRWCTCSRGGRTPTKTMWSTWWWSRRCEGRSPRPRMGHRP